MENTVSILGARGSVPVGGAEYARYGGATTCFLLRFGDQAILIDAGTGLMRLPAALLQEPELPLLLTHPHADHLLGLPLCPYVMRPGARLDIYAKTRNGLDAEAQVTRLLSPPLWPVEPRRLPAEIGFHELPSSLSFGGVEVETMEGVHPGGVSLLRLTGNGKRAAVLTDCTLTEELLPGALRFIAGCDLLLCDGQYSEAEWPRRRGFGHSTWTAAARFGAAGGVRQMRIIHHDPRRTDGALDAAGAEVLSIHPGCAFAYEGEEIAL